MIYKINITAPARKDIYDAVKYIAEDLRDKVAADRLLGEILSATVSLEEMPLRHALIEDSFLKIYGLRCFPIKNYIVFYIVREEIKTVVVERVLYNARNWSDILKDI